MKKRTHAALDSVLSWAGFGLGYSDDEEPLVDASPVAVEAPRVKPHPTKLVVPKPAASSTSEPPTPHEETAGPHWTDLITISAERRVEVWHDLEQDVVDRWHTWLQPRLASIDRRYQSWVGGLRGCTDALQAMADRRRAQWRALTRRVTFRRPTDTSPPVEPQPSTPRPLGETQEVTAPRDRITRVLERVSRDDGDGEARRTGLNRLAEDDEADIFADAWAVDAPTQVDDRPETSSLESETDSPRIAITRLNRMLEQPDEPNEPFGAKRPE